jgi:hypothetical protein
VLESKLVKSENDKQLSEKEVAYEAQVSRRRRRVIPILVGIFTLALGIVANLLADSIQNMFNISQYQIGIWAIFGFTFIITVLLNYLKSRELKLEEAIKKGAVKRLSLEEESIIQALNNHIDSLIVLAQVPDEQSYDKPTAL